jgi:diguanylate cyclase (GGDEF)-like protein
MEALRLLRQGLALVLRQHEVRRLNRRLADANDRLAELARTDVLTGVANRRAFDERLAEEWARAVRDGQLLAAVMLDIDLFKIYNDRFGHPAGDECLRQVGQVLRALPRGADFVARLGGEEFCLLLPGTDEAGAAALAEVIRSRIQKLALPHPATPQKVVTVSMGLAAIAPSQVGSPAILIEQADKALYAAKRDGRNRVVPASTLPGWTTSAMR